MPSKSKIDLVKVLASLNTLCTKCGYSIPPNETQRTSHRDAVPEVQSGVRLRRYDSDGEIRKQVDEILEREKKS